MTAAQYAAMRQLDLRGADDPDCVERAVYELFIFLHRRHAIEPSASNRYRLRKVVEKWDVQLILELLNPHVDVWPDPGALLLSRERVTKYCEEIARWGKGWGDALSTHHP